MSTMISGSISYLLFGLRKPFLYFCPPLFVNSDFFFKLLTYYINLLINLQPESNGYLK